MPPPERSSSPDHPDPEHVGSHLVLDKTDLFPGTDPEYLDYRYRCLLCGVERPSLESFPGACDGQDRDD